LPDSSARTMKEHERQKPFWKKSKRDWDCTVTEGTCEKTETPSTCKAGPRTIEFESCKFFWGVSKTGRIALEGPCRVSMRGAPVSSGKTSHTWVVNMLAHPDIPESRGIQVVPYSEQNSLTLVPANYCNDVGKKAEIARIESAMTITVSSELKTLVEDVQGKQEWLDTDRDNHEAEFERKRTAENNPRIMRTEGGTMNLSGPTGTCDLTDNAACCLKATENMWQACTMQETGMKYDKARTAGPVKAGLELSFWIPQ